MGPGNHLLYLSQKILETITETDTFIYLQTAAIQYSACALSNLVLHDLSDGNTINGARRSARGDICGAIFLC